MSDWQDGYSGLARPANNDWTAFNAGIAQRQHEQALADMAARASAPLNSMGGNNAPPPYVGTYAPGSGKIALWLTAVFLVVFTVVKGCDGVVDGLNHRARQARAAEEAALQRENDRRWIPALNKALRSYDTSRDLAAILGARRISPCYAQTIGNLLVGRTGNWGSCRYSSPDWNRGPITAYVAYDRFSVEYRSFGPPIRHEVWVMALTPDMLHAGDAMGRRSPVDVALGQFGRNGIEPYLTRRCLAMAADRVASSRPVDSDGKRDKPISYAKLSTIAIACPRPDGSYRLERSEALAA